MVEGLGLFAWNIMAFLYDRVDEVGRAVYQFRVNDPRTVGDPAANAGRLRAVEDLRGRGWVTVTHRGEIGPCEEGRQAWLDYRRRCPIQPGEPEVPQDMLEALRRAAGRVGQERFDEDMRREMRDGHADALDANLAAELGIPAPPLEPPQRPPVYRRNPRPAPAAPAAPRKTKRPQYRFINPADA